VHLRRIMFFTSPLLFCFVSNNLLPQSVRNPFLPFIRTNISGAFLRALNPAAYPPVQVIMILVHSTNTPPLTTFHSCSCHDASSPKYTSMQLYPDHEADGSRKLLFIFPRKYMQLETNCQDYVQLVILELGSCWYISELKIAGSMLFCLQ
jgi:hypothetical protein